MTKLEARILRIEQTLKLEPVFEDISKLENEIKIMSNLCNVPSAVALDVIRNGEINRQFRENMEEAERTEGEK